MPKTLLASAAFVLILCACAVLDAHENFKEIMQGEVGKSVDNPYLTRNQYRNRLVNTRQLANGNVEEEYKTGRGLRCRTFFELDQKSGKVASWRYEGTKDDCAIVP
jgi:hypothetical protein